MPFFKSRVPLIYFISLPTTSDLFFLYQFFFSLFFSLTTSLSLPFGLLLYAYLHLCWPDFRLSTEVGICTLAESYLCILVDNSIQKKNYIELFWVFVQIFPACLVNEPNRLWTLSSRLQMRRTFSKRSRRQSISFHS